MKVLIPTPLRQYTAKQASVDVTAQTVSEMLSQLTGQFPELRKQLFTDDGKLRRFVNVYVNDEDIRYLEHENTAIKENDTISIVPSVAGGSSGQGLVDCEFRCSSRFSVEARAFRPRAIASMRLQPLRQEPQRRKRFLHVGGRGTEGPLYPN